MDKKDSEAFLKFLDKIQNQNKADLALQALQTKYEREIAGEDDDKREKQLDKVAELLENIEKAITGVGVKFDFKPLVNALENQTQILQKSLEEQSLLRKVSEGSLEYDKESAQYRNTSGRELTSDVSGKTIKQGGYIDFETAANRLQGQGKRVREAEANQIKLKPIEMGVKAPVQRQAPAGIEPKKETKEDVPGFGNLADLGQGIKDRITGIFDFLTKDIKERGLFGKKSEEVEKKKDTTPSPGVTGLNPEADNIQSSQEIMADAAKEDVALTKENNQLLQQQLTELKKLNEALAPKTPSELPIQDKLKPTPGSAQAQEGEGGLGLGDALAGLAGIGGIAKKAGGALLKGAKAVGTGALAAGKGIARFAGTGAGKALGATAAVGLGAYTAYKGYTGAEDEKQKEIASVDAKVKAGELTPEQAVEQKKEIAAKATENKSGAVGKGTGMAAGAIGGGIAGAKVGATIGTFLGGPVGTAIGAGIGTIAGGAIGAISGSSVGQNIGGAIGKGVAGVKSFFGAEDIGKETKEAVTGKTEETSTEIKFSEMEFAKNDPENYKKFNEFVTTRTEELSKKYFESGKFGKSEQAKQIAGNAARLTAKQEGIKKFQKEIEAAGAGSVTTKTKESKPGEIGKAGSVVEGKQKAGPNYAEFLKNQEPGSTEVSHLEKQYPGIEKKYIELANASTPKSDSQTSIDIHKKMLKTMAIKAMAEEKDKGVEGKKEGPKPEVEGKKEGPKPEVEGKTETKTLGQGITDSLSKADSVRAEAKRLGLDPNKVQGVMEGGVLTAVVDKESGKRHEVAVSEEDQKRVNAARELRAANQKSGELERAARSTAGLEVKEQTMQNRDLAREANKPAPAISPIVSNSVNNNNTTSYVPIKPTPRPERTGSALDRYNDRVASF